MSCGWSPQRRLRSCVAGAGAGAGAVASSCSSVSTPSMRTADASGAVLQSKTDKERMKESRKEKKKKASERNRKKLRSACGGSAEINPPGIHEDASCIPGLAHWLNHPVLISPRAWERLCAWPCGPKETDSKTESDTKQKSKQASKRDCQYQMGGGREMAQISASPNPGPESGATLAGPVCLLPCADCGVVARLRAARLSGP